MKHESLAGFPVVVAAPVHWGDQDSFGHVNNTVYLRWCETARVEYLSRIGLMVASPAEGVAPIVASVACDYRRPVTYPDTIHVGTRVTRVGTSSLRMEHCVVSERLNAVVAEAHSTVVMLDYQQNRSVPVPEDARHAIERLEGGAPSAAPVE
jgi:acyl-CoA thioester hydrolase